MSERCPVCGTPLVESDPYLAAIMEQSTHWYCPKACSTETEKAGMQP